MCGFVGYFGREASGQTAGERSRLEAALAAISHRGPDDHHIERGKRYWMGFRRLAILDLSENGRQPMLFDGGRYVLTFNGEIYNYRELRHLVADDDLRSTGDTEVFGRLLARHGVEATLRMVRGMFAFAWWDRVAGELTAGRDFFGIKPLYYAQPMEGQILVSSEVKAIRRVLGERAKVSSEAVRQYLRWGSVQAPETILAGVKSLLPGEVLRWKKGKIARQRYFEPAWMDSDGWWESHDFCVAETRRRVIESVKAHLVSDVPVGVFLSAGLDSSIIAASMREAGASQIEAFSIGYEGDAGVEDESDTAERTAGFLGAKFTRERISAERLRGHFDDYIGRLDQPTGDALNTYLVSRLAAESVKVCLSGLGADEWFGGYNHHRLGLLARWGRVVPGGVGQAVWAGASRMIPERSRQGRLAKAAGYAMGAEGRRAEGFYRAAREVIKEDGIEGILGEGLAGGGDGRGAEIEEWLGRTGEEPGASWLHDLLLLETRGYLANTLLRDNDSVSMAHSLELRVPLVDAEVFKLSAYLPPKEKVGLAGGKLVLREAFRELIPSWILEDRRKKTFTLPLMKWLRAPGWREQVRDVLGSAACRQRGWLREKAVEELMARYEEAGLEGRSGWFLSQRVWLCFVLESWAQSHLDSH